tara:strand:+ start:83 stop:295 length:213 start_codon:yes stop_codon:yes gene_type:complete
MFKMFAIICLLVNGEPQCTQYSDSHMQIFDNKIACEQAASARFYEMMDGFIQYNIPFEQITIGCEGSEDS